MEKQRDIKGWIILLVCMGSLLYSIVNSWSLRGNDLKHLTDKVDGIITRLERIENMYFTKGE